MRMLEKKFKGCDRKRDDHLSIVKKHKLGWPRHLERLWHDQDNTTRDSKRNEKERKIVKAVGKQYKGLDWGICMMS